MRFQKMTRKHSGLLAFCLCLLALFAPGAQAQTPSPSAQVSSVDSIGITVSDMEQAVDFYSRALTFQKVSDVEVWGSETERLQGVFGLRMRVVRMKLGEET